MVLKISDLRKQKTVIPMRQETKDLSPTVGFPNYSPGKGTSQTPKDSLSCGDGAECGDTHAARVHRADHQKGEGTIKVSEGPPQIFS